MLGRESVVENKTIEPIDDSLVFTMINQGNTAEVYLYKDNKYLSYLEKACL